MPRFTKNYQFQKKRKEKSELDLVPYINSIQVNSARVSSWVHVQAHVQTLQAYYTQSPKIIFRP